MFGRRSRGTAACQQEERCTGGFDHMQSSLSVVCCLRNGGSRAEFAHCATGWGSRARYSNLGYPLWVATCWALRATVTIHPCRCCPGRGTTKQGRLWTHVRDDRGRRGKYPYRRRSASVWESGPGRFWSGTSKTIRWSCAEQGGTALKRCTVRSSRRAIPHRPRKIRKRRFGSTSVRSMRAVDTNVLVRLLVRDDLNQLKAAESFIA
jgi:hypothetical protein